MTSDLPGTSGAPWRRRLARMVGTSLLAACAGDAARDADVEIYRRALVSLRAELEYDSTVAIHPLLLLRPAGNVRGGPPLADFNAGDTTSMSRLVGSLGSGYRRCATRPGGSCEAAPGEVAIILSEATENGPNGVGVYAIVTDGRQGRRYQSYYLIRLKRTFGGEWGVVEVRRLP